MGNPRRFFGTGEAVTIDGVTIPPRCAVEVTFRTHQQRFFLRPDEDANEIILGCFGRAYHRYPELNVSVLDVKSNHGTFLAVPDSPHVLSSFMRDFLSTTANRINDLRNREGTFWERRYRAIPVTDEAAMEDRFRYILTQGTKENLVLSARDWPGITSIDALLGGKPLVGRWRDGTATGILRRQRERKLERARASGRELELPEAPVVYREYPIELVPMPHWKELKVGQRRARVADMLRADDQNTRARHEHDGTRPLGIDGLLQTHPFDHPREPAKSPAPLCHASTRKGRRAYKTLYDAFMQVTDESREKVAKALPTVGVPLDSTVPPLSHHNTLPPRPPDPPLVIDTKARAATPTNGPPLDET